MDTIEAQGMQVPAIGLGTWQIEGTECRRIVERALDLGYRHIDTAQAYGNEAPIGAAIRQSGLPREDLFVTSKVWLDHCRRDDVIRTTHETIKRLATDRLDLMLVHWPSHEVPLRETFGALMELQEERLIDRIGVSNFTPGLLQEAMTLAPISSIQVEYHPFLSQEGLLAIARQKDLLFTAYSPLARGEVAEEPTLREIGEAHGKTPAQVTLRWLIQQHNVAAIPKASSEEHLRANLDVFDFELTTQEERRISKLERGERLIDPEFAPNWGR